MDPCWGFRWFWGFEQGSFNDAWVITWIGTHNAPPQPLGHGRQLPVKIPESRGLVALLWVYPHQTCMGFNSPANEQSWWYCWISAPYEANPCSKWAASSDSEMQDSSGFSMTCSYSWGSGVGEEGADEEAGATGSFFTTSNISKFRRPSSSMRGQDIGRAPASLQIALLGVFQIAQHRSEEPQPGQLFLPPHFSVVMAPLEIFQGKVFPLPQHLQTGWGDPPSILSSCAAGTWKVIACWWVSFWIAESQGHSSRDWNSLHHLGTL